MLGQCGRGRGDEETRFMMHRCRRRKKLLKMQVTNVKGKEKDTAGKRSKAKMISKYTKRC